MDLFYTVLLIYITLIIVVSAKPGDSSDVCSRIFDISNRTIIKTTESINQGAKFLKSTKASTRDKCMMACCNFEGCNMAVLQEKVDGDCYLFDCGTLEDFKCAFSVHDDHVSMGMMINRNDLQKTKVHEQAKHEMDLNLLKTQQDIQQQQAQQQQQNQDAAPEPEPEPIPTPAPTQFNNNNNNNYNYNNYNNNNDDGKLLAQQNEQAANDVRQRRPPLRQEDLSANSDDSAGSKSNGAKSISKPKSVMDKNIGKPQRPFNSQTFKKQPTNSGCSPVQWQCESNDQCIAVYDKCDGIAQCVDKSDEKNCDVKPQPETGSRSDGGQSQQNPQMWGQYYPADRPPQSSNEFLRPDQSDRNRNQQQQQQQNLNDYQNYDNNNNQNNQQQQQQQQQQNLGDNQQQQNPNWSGQQAPKQQQQFIKQNNKNFNRPVNVDKNFRNPPPPMATVSRKESETNVAVSIEHLDYGRGSTSLAAVMLGLGLAVLALLLLFISCRLRTARRRLRRGKVLDTDEGEYLINGMYL